MPCMVSGSQDTQRTHLDKTPVQEGFSRSFSPGLLSPPPGCEEPEPPGLGLGPGLGPGPGLGLGSGQGQGEVSGKLVNRNATPHCCI